MTVDVPIAAAFDLDSLKSCIVEEGHGIDVDDAVVRSGTQNVVVETDDWIVRFPRDDSVSVAWEANLLMLLRGKLKIQTPNVRWLGSRTRCMAYPKIIGVPFDRVAYVAQSSKRRTDFATTIAESLVALQDVLGSPSLAEADLPADDFTKFHTPLREHLHDFPSGAQSRMRDLLDEYAELYLSPTSRVEVAMHNDFHFGNLVLDAPLGRVVGVWDFSCAARGSAEWDLRYFEGDLASPWETPVHLPGEHHDLLRRVARAYGTLRGTTIDVRASVVANRVEALFDLWTDGAVGAFRGWDEWDARGSGRDT